MESGDCMSGFRLKGQTGTDDNEMEGTRPYVRSLAPLSGPFVQHRAKQDSVSSAPPPKTNTNTRFWGFFQYLRNENTTSVLTWFQIVLSRTLSPAPDSENQTLVFGERTSPHEFCTITGIPQLFCNVGEHDLPVSFVSAVTSAGSVTGGD